MKDKKGQTTAVLFDITYTYCIDDSMKAMHQITTQIKAEQLCIIVFYNDGHWDYTD